MLGRGEAPTGFTQRDKDVAGTTRESYGGGGEAAQGNPLKQHYYGQTKMLKAWLLQIGASREGGDTMGAHHAAARETSQALGNDPHVSYVTEESLKGPSYNVVRNGKGSHQHLSVSTDALASGWKQVRQ
jgi:hypothetical protein